MTFTTTILEWFRQHGRELPWRQTRDPYAIWLSETILQQTRIEQGRPYWEAFMRRWPTVERLAGATEDEVLRQWQGLGYYSRARNLYAAARQVVAMGGFPTTQEGLRTLRGVGDYTAAAIASFAFHLPAAVVDGNVYRVLSRYFGISTPINTTAGKKEFALLAQSLLPEDSGVGADYNQAIMDFGATQCTPHQPRCASCPLQDTCVALHEGRTATLPVKERKLKVRERHLTYIYIRCSGHVALHRRPAGDIWQGLYEPLLVETEAEKARWEEMRVSSASAAAADATANLPVPRRIRRNVRHVLTHQRLTADFYLWEPAERPPLPAGYFWIPEADVDSYAVPRLVELLLQSL